MPQRINGHHEPSEGLSRTSWRSNEDIVASAKRWPSFTLRLCRPTWETTSKPFRHDRVELLKVSNRG
jgi:hypothetical protein